ncbi:MAG: hypothetical protein RB191_02235 [Terriglobia bacterium]|nr:hypothetical protein [Terriglobia bacterium]
MNRFYGLGFTRLADDQVAYFGRAVAGQRDGMQFVIMAESDSHLQWLWGRLNPSVQLDPKGVHNCGLTHGTTLRKFLQPSDSEEAALAHESSEPVEISARRKQLRRLERVLIEAVQSDRGQAPQALQDALTWVVGQLNATVASKRERMIRAAAADKAESPT